MKNHTFDGTDPICVFYIFAHFVNEADMINMSVAHSFMSSSTFLVEPAETQFRMNFRGASRHGGIIC